MRQERNRGHGEAAGHSQASRPPSEVQVPHSSQGDAAHMEPTAPAPSQSPRPVSEAQKLSSLQASAVSKLVDNEIESPATLAPAKIPLSLQEELPTTLIDTAGNADNDNSAYSSYGFQYEDEFYESDEPTGKKPKWL